MQNWKRALLYIKRKKGKSLMLFAIIWVCLLSVLVAGAVRNRTNEVTSQLKEKLSGYFTIIPDLDVEGAAEMLTDDFCKDVLKDTNIMAYNGIEVYYMCTPELLLTPGRFGAQGKEDLAHVARFVGSTDTRYNEQFYLGELELKEGEHIRADDEGMALISENFAKDNSLCVGDEFDSLVTPGYQGRNDEALGQTFTYKVKGIYHIKNATKDSSSMAECDIPENYIFIDAKTGHSIVSILREDETDWYRYGVNFYIRDSGNFKETVENLKESLGLDEAYRIEENNGKYLKSSEPLEKVIRMTGIFIITVLILSAAILCLILFMWMKDRKHEVGIYLAAGLGKRDILVQLLIESMLLYLAAFAAAMLCANVVMGGVGNLLFAGDLMNMENSVTMGIKGADVLAAAACGCVIQLCAVLVSFLTVARMGPKEILSTNQ